MLILRIESQSESMCVVCKNPEFKRLQLRYIQKLHAQKLHRNCIETTFAEKRWIFTFSFFVIKAIKVSKVPFSFQTDAVLMKKEPALCHLKNRMESKHNNQNVRFWLYEASLGSRLLEELIVRSTLFEMQNAKCECEVLNKKHHDFSKN